MEQINFYQALKHPSPFNVTLERLIAIMIGLVGILFFVSILQTLFIYYQSYHIKSLNNKSIAISKKIQELQSQSVRIQTEKQLLQRIATTKTIINQKQAILQLLSANATPQQYQLTPFLSVLAHFDTPGIWLTQIDIKDYGKQITLQGSANTSSAVTQYLKAIQSQAAFAGKIFDDVKITVPDKSEYINFTITTKAKT